MKQRCKFGWLYASLALCFWGGVMSYTAPTADAQSSIRIAWADCAPADFLNGLTAQFTQETGISVEIVQYPWTEFQGAVEDVWANKKDSFDLIIGDSQWLGTGATKGHYADLTDLVKSVKDKFTEQSIAYYSEYPQGSGKYYGIPCESDALGFAYRKDLFENATEKANFKSKYGRDLAVPKTWSEFGDIAEFFTRPASSFYGAALMYSIDYDYITMNFQPFLWSFGGAWSDSANQAEGAVNSPKSVQALTFFINLLNFNPPNAKNFTHDDATASYLKGESVMCIEWFSFMSSFTSASNPYKDKTGFFALPGESQRFISLGGQGISLSAYSKKQDLAKQFLAWFVKDDTQLKWAKAGGLSSSKSVNASQDFLTMQPFNETFVNTLPYIKDFYNNPAYASLLSVAQAKLHAAAEGTLTPQAALDGIAAEHAKILAQNSGATTWELY